MAEVKKWQFVDSTHKAFKNLDKCIGTYLEKLNTHFTDKGKHDEEREKHNEERADVTGERTNANANIS